MNADEMFENLIRDIAVSNRNMDLERIRDAYNLAKDAHAGQKRKDGSDYITHCVSAARICFEMGLDEDSIIGALLHDIIEDTPITYEEVSRHFGPVIADLVEGVSKLTRVQYTSQEDEQVENLRKMLLAMAKDIRVIFIKIADRLHNMRTLRFQQPELSDFLNP